MAESLAKVAVRLRKAFGSATVDTYTLNRVYLMAVTEMLEKYGYPATALRLFEWGYAMGHAYMLKLERELEKLKPEPKVTRMVAWLAWYMFSGTKPKIEQRVIPEPGFPYPVSVTYVRDPNSPWDQEIFLGEYRRASHYPAGAYEAAGNTYGVLVTKGAIRTLARITKAISAGDKYTELAFVTVPAQLASEDYIESLVPGFFSEIPFKKSQELYEKYFGIKW
ncbi:hypothetical protein IG193_01360 [Infirmifilum lucidum]|uniref:Uncharacterized protein n=1 Tax=Infirmifilum lucidum TaxID=2776706 RepID=A0A7L9FH29_9CREN|nr:hypothetical protein [Infirmifilum lucidum]QOJ79138.1 hypothetical protein IG193_01360 [Infirmifilum lucidum]